MEQREEKSRMLLTIATSSNTNTVGELVTWLECHPQSVIIIKTLIDTLVPCICFREIFLFVLKPYIERRNKRIEAETTLYPALRLRISTLKALLEQWDRIDYLNIEKGNIYSIRYKEEDLFRKCSAYERVSKDEIKQFHEAAERVKIIIENSNANVPPKNSQKNKWEKSQKEIILFCDLLRAIYNGQSIAQFNTSVDSSTEPPHIAACKELVVSMNYLTRDFNKYPDSKTV